VVKSTYVENLLINFLCASGCCEIFWLGDAFTLQVNFDEKINFKGLLGKNHPKKTKSFQIKSFDPFERFKTLRKK